ncbi:DUF4198 domain-containing protein [Acidovorax cavernicola]|uniref:DUF4198 domain-containing protein n=1 Tax=Acidovorax cavernicola TaxID=1675792 RepID=A0A9X8D3Y7_9BURK|nr:DUF4198 domain-containing protein [Acidovorax cavernicola]RIX78638.1 DUF4198 domain-containing protein [Acidovorax cavernicola]
MIRFFHRRTLALAVGALLSLSAQAHRSFLVPSSTVLSSTPNQWVSVDAARGNDLFFFNHNAMPLEGLAITAPDGQSVSPAKLERFRHRAVFDWQLTQPGTWRAAVVEEGLRAQWEEGGKPRRWSGAPAKFAEAVPADAAKLQVNEVQSRVETFVTMGAPTPLAQTGRGLEAHYQPHPNDLTAGQPSTLTLVLDGKPAAGVKVTIVPGGIRYRNDTQQIEQVTDSQGRIVVRWPAAGLYWLSASQRGDSTMAPARQRHISYVATLEVMPE